MKKYKIEATRIDEYDIEVDETIWTEEEIKKWSKTFWPAETTEDIAKHLAGCIMKLGSDYGFIDGFGYVETFRCDGSRRKQFDSEFKEIPEDHYTLGISIKIITEDDDYEYDINEK